MGIQEGVRNHVGQGYTDEVAGWMQFLPIRIQCASRRCGIVQVLDPGTLSVDQFPWPAGGRIGDMPGSNWAISVDGEVYKRHLMRRGLVD
jgi:hypothetical protein